MINVEVSPVVLNALVNDNTKHDDEADADDNCERQQIRIDVERLVVRNNDSDMLVGIPHVPLEELAGAVEADEDGRDEGVVVATHGYHLNILQHVLYCIYKIHKMSSMCLDRPVVFIRRLTLLDSTLKTMAAEKFAFVAWRIFSSKVHPP